MSKVMQFVDAAGRPIVEALPREGDSLDVGFGGPIGNLMEKLSYAKQVMEASEELYPYAKTGVKRSGKLTTATEEVEKIGTKSLKSLREAIHDNDEDETPAPQSIKQIPRSIQKPALAPKTQQVIAKPKNKKPLYEDENYIYYAKDGVQEEDEYDVRKAPSLTSELLKASQAEGKSSSMPDMTAAINERMIKGSKLPDVIKQSFLKNPLTPPKLSSALSGGKLDAITEQFRKQKLIKSNSTVPTSASQNVIAVPKKKIVEETSVPTAASKREKIKAQLKPIVKELIREILSEGL